MNTSKVVNLCRLVLQKAIKKYGDPMELADASDEREEESLADNVLITIEDLCFNDSSLIIMETLDFDEDWDSDDEEGEQEEAEEVTDSPHSQNVSQEWEEVQIGNQKYSLDVMTNVLMFYDKCKSKAFKQTSNRYPFIKDYNTIYRFREYVSNNGRKVDKFKKLEEHVIKKFLDARDALACVSERDLIRWGMSKARELNLNFQASRGWLHLLKKKARIVSRKITKLTTKKEVMNLDTTIETGKLFVEKIKSRIVGLPTGSLWNFDQSSFNYGHSNMRTLSRKGEKETLMLVNSMNAATHSYSVMPLLSMDGKLASKMLVCLQETGGDFGPNVKKGMTVPDNIYICSSKSGKLDKKIMREWINNYVSKLSPNEAIALLHDSWAGQTDTGIYREIPNLKFVEQIPPKTTQWFQPLDTYFFRQYKIVKRRICDRVMLDEVEIDLEKRQNVLLLQSLIYNQFQSSMFQPMLRYSWFKCGYIEERAGYFMNANEILFEIGDNECEITGCTNDCFIRCSHCRKYLCIQHFLVDNHYHKV